MSTHKKPKYPLLAAFACYYYGCPKEWAWTYLIRWASEGGKPDDVPADYFGFTLYDSAAHVNASRVTR